jgi:hypothetical protein
MALRFIIGTVSTVVLTFSAAVFAQQPSQGTASIPDFSGIWAHQEKRSGHDSWS